MSAMTLDDAQDFMVRCLVLKRRGLDKAIVVKLFKSGDERMLAAFERVSDADLHLVKGASA
jgi:hypothetical protein